MKNWRLLVLLFVFSLYFLTPVEMHSQNYQNRTESSISSAGNNKWKARLSARDKWFDTKIKVTPGATINIFATGIINWGPPPGDENTPFTVSPNGTRPPYEADKYRFPMPDAGCGSLIMRIGNSVYFVGEENSIKAIESGTIQLMVNDDILSDNSGNFTVNIEISHSITSFCKNAAKKVGALIALENDNGNKIPLILIHGIHGTEPNQKVTEANQYWNTFKASFKNNNYLTSKYVLYVFQYYSNREPVQNIGCELGLFIDEKIPDRPYVFVAHSMGGLVAKAYMVFYQHMKGNWYGMVGGETVSRVITLATPHHGTHASNDVNALEDYIRFGWKPVISMLNFFYWWKSTEFYSPQSIASGMPNRSDLRWD